MTKNNSAKINVLPLLALRGKFVFPDSTTVLDAGRKASLSAINQATDADMLIFLSAQKDMQQDEITTDDIYKIGTVAKITQITKISKECLRLSVTGLYRARAIEINSQEDYFSAVVEEMQPVHDDSILEEAYFRTIRDTMRDMQFSDMRISKDVMATLFKIKDPDVYINNVANALPLRDEVKQQLLETTNVLERLRLFENCLNEEMEIAKLEKKISATVRKNIDKNQKEYFLREQLRAIHTELGDDEQENDELAVLIKSKGMPKEIEEKALKELFRMSKIPPSSPEYTIIRNYIDWLCDLPWCTETVDTEKLADCKKVLDQDHYGLDKIKERITEYLAVLKLTKSMKAPVLCFVGPPGVGKTSIAKSVARALNRKFVRMSLGGVKDEAEIRGHRRTYVGAMPGRIIYSMKLAGSINPVFLLDEIDKVSTDMRGDPASALLEVLDPEQTDTFIDRYLDVPYDLSKVMFITTANSLDTIPTPLLDRMEIIELNGYTLEEKKEIAKRYLIPKQIIANGLNDDIISINDEAILKIIEDYTMEAGVRSLERKIGAVCRKIAVKYADNKNLQKVEVTKENLEEFLGIPRYSGDNTHLDDNEIGAATGLAWTAVGGTTLTIEVSTMKGHGDIQLTGKLGDVMKESARAAISYIRSNAEKYQIEDNVFENTDIHIHVPEGATPKDGPSAGITMATAILSAFTHKPVRNDVAMTGEITLRGKVLPIGGLKEKTIAAHRIGIKNVIIPDENKKDLQDIPNEVKDDINFICVNEIDSVFQNAILGL